MHRDFFINKDIREMGVYYLRASRSISLSDPQLENLLAIVEIIKSSTYRRIEGSFPSIVWQEEWVSRERTQFG